MKSDVALALAVAAVGIACPPLVAHHSFALAYDANRPVTLKGTVTRIDLRSPHSHLFLDVQDDKGHTGNWNFELASPTVLLQSGWRARTVNVGDTVTIEGAMARDGSMVVNARIVILADGRRLSAGSSGGDAPARENPSPPAP